MKMKNRFIYIIIALMTIGLSGCGSFLDVNDDPNNPTEEYMTLEYRLPAALYHTALQEVTQLNQLGSFWAGYWGPNTDGTNSYKKEQLYNGFSIMAKRDGIPIWENGYTYLNYYELLKKQADKEGARHYGAIARIMQAWHYMRLVDVYGDVPFDQALQDDKYPRPVYDDGKYVYQKSMEMINVAIDMLKQTPAARESVPRSADIVFAGDPVKWMKFANTLKLRALLRQSEVGESSYITDEIAKINSDGNGFITEIAFVQPGFNASNLNPFWSTYYRNTSNKTTTTYTYIRPTQYIIDRYESLNDPRVGKLYVENPNGDYKGVPFGYLGSSAVYNKTNTSAFRGPSENGNKPGGILKSSTQPIVLLGDFESWFLQAEAAQRGWISGNTQEFYENGVRASFKYMEVAQADTDAYFSQADVAFNNTLDRIILQKWLALNSISGFEAWCDFRRLSIPSIPNSESAAAGEYPGRLMYPETEAQTNIAQVKKKNITVITKARVWWDINKLK
ncbi:SusD family outer membrane protein [Mucinivorans hirudinis]|uniref:SusD family outer membrane protein n=1 Tax=Mucinivorans hirudinis TaxID=1433126 RepID=A0A060RAK0_9BACT|nr:SusD family outer membrane protein [Mucinivorans hirudinis]